MSYSQAGQDMFVLETLKYKQYGTYVEIGAYHSTEMSNTYLLEKDYFWRGIGVEIVPERVIEYNTNRNNPCIEADATILDYEALFKSHNMPNRIDYLQLDIEPAHNTLAALKRIPLDKYRFSVITFEHDLYADPNNAAIKQDQINILWANGYKLVKENVIFEEWNAIFEDWWIDPTAF